MRGWWLTAPRLGPRGRHGQTPRASLCSSAFVLSRSAGLSVSSPAEGVLGPVPMVCLYQGAGLGQTAWGKDALAAGFPWPAVGASAWSLVQAFTQAEQDSPDLAAGLSPEVGRRECARWEGQGSGEPQRLHATLPLLALRSTQGACAISDTHTCGPGPSGWSGRQVWLGPARSPVTRSRSPRRARPQELRLPRACKCSLLPQGPL